MFKTNEYFGGQVTSIAFNTPEWPATVGVMAPGEYEFGTSATEYMTVTSGELLIMFPGSDIWQSFKANETFVVEKDVKFKVKVITDTSYLCIYQ
jgi:purine/pyrimidine-nucleoside phosphorylase